MEINSFAIYLIMVLALFLLISGIMLRSELTRRGSLKSGVPRPQPVAVVNTTPAPVPDRRDWKPTSEVPRPLATSAAPVSRHNAVPPRIVAGNDYLRNNPMSHLQSFRVGLEGEKRVLDQMQRVLDGQWTIFHNVDLGDQAGDIDIVLVGPGGTWAVEVKTYTGDFRVENGRWYKKTRNGHMARMRRGPGAQVRTNAIRLCEYLKEHGVTHNSYVGRAVIMSGEAPVEVVSAGTRIWMLEDLDAQLAFLNRDRRYSHDHVRLVAGVIERACSPEIALH